MPVVTVQRLPSHSNPQGPQSIRRRGERSAGLGVHTLTTQRAAVAAIRGAHATPRVRLVPASVGDARTAMLARVADSDDGVPTLVRLARILGLVPALARAVMHLPSDLTLVVLAAVIIHAVARAAFPRRTRTLAWLDVVFAALVVGLTGGPASIHAPYALICVIDAAFALGPIRGSLAGLGVALVAAVSGFHAVLVQLRQPRAIIPWLALFPVVGLAGGLAGRIKRDASRPHAGIVAEANRALSSLYRIACTMPGGLETANVAAAALEQVREMLSTPAAAVVALTDEQPRVAGAFGMPDRGAIVRLARAQADARAPRVLRRWQVAEDLREVLGPCDGWVIVPLRRRAEVEGLLIVGILGGVQPDVGVLEAVAGELAGALENARLFEQVRRLSIDEERFRVGRDLHDGVAQALTHIRFELELLAASQADPGDMRDEARRLAGVAAGALTDVRATVAGLRSPIGEGSLAASLRAHAATLRGPGVAPLRVECEGDIRLDPGVQDELFRIAQEAISNAIRHAEASEIVVRLAARGDLVWLEIEDDGIGMPDGGPLDAGVGLKAMWERASAACAQLAVRQRPEGGTRVEVLCRARMDVPA